MNTVVRLASLTAIALAFCLSAGPAAAQTNGQITYNFNSLNGSPAQYIEGNLKVEGLYTTGTNPFVTAVGHLHGSGDVYTHASCCSDWYLFTSIDGSTFSPTSFLLTRGPGTSYVIAPDGTQVQVTTSNGGTFSFPSGGSWEGITSFVVYTAVSEIGLDNLLLTYNAAPVATPQTVSTNEDVPLSITLSATDAENDALTYVVVTNPSNGTVSGSPPTITYTPTTDFNGSDSLTFTAADAYGTSNVATVSITISAVNDAPVASPVSLTTDEDMSVALTLVATDVDNLDSSLTYSIASQPNNGAVAGSGNSWTYTPDPDYNGTDTFQVQAYDGLLYSSAVNVTITVNGVNDAPSVSPMSVSTQEDNSTAIVLAGNDPDGDNVAYTVVASPTHGTLTGTAPNLTYTPVADYNGTDTFTYKGNDGVLDSNTATVTITIAAVNDIPIAFGQALQTSEDLPLGIALSGSDVDVDSLTYAVVGTPSNGTLTGTAPSVTYTPDTNYSGSDSFTFTVNDGQVSSGPATVSILVGGVNDAPIAAPQTLSTPEDSPLSITLSATDADADPLTYAVVVNSTQGTLTGTGSSLTYTPNANFHGTDTFQFKANDGTVDSNVALVSLTVTPVNDAPTANNQNLATAEETALAIALTGNDLDGDSLTYAVTSSPNLGTLAGTAPNLSYEPNVDTSGTDSFAFQVSDGVLTGSGTVTITINPVNDTPVANNLSATTSEDVAVNITLSGSDADGDSLTFSVTTTPANGTLSGTSPAMTYTPNADFTGSDSFTYQATDGLIGSAIATVTISVSSVNDMPIADAGGPYTVDEGLALILLGDGSADSDGSVVNWEWDCTNDGSYDGTGIVMSGCVYPDDGTYTVSLRVTDDSGGQHIATDTVTVNNVAPVPNAIAGPTFGDEGSVLSFSGSAIDVAADTPTFSWSFGDGSPSAVGSSVSHTYADQDVYQITLTASDEDGGSATTTMLVTVFNVAPTITSLTGPTTGDEGSTLSWSATSSDPGADTATYSWNFGDGSPTAIGAAASHAYADQGTYLVTLTADDGDGGLSQSVFQVVVANVAPTITSLGGDSTGDEMATLYWYAYSSDPGDDTVTYEWDYGDGTDSQVASYGAHAYADDGVYTLTVTASDEDGGSTTDTMQVTVLNVAPAFTSVDVPASANEGETKTFTAAATDVAEDIDDLAYSWNFGDGTPAALGDSVEHAFADDGEYSVTVTVVDGDGGSTPSSATVVVYNVAPEIISSAPEYALENVTYTYNIVVEDPGDEVFSFTLSPSAPSAMSIDPDYGIVSWTPNYDDSLVGSFAVTVTVDDGDGDTDVQTWTIQVGYADDDVDGMADDWEEANGLDSSDGGDGILDSDGDGVTNVEEFLSGTDPQVFDGPETPVIVSPMDDEEVETSVPTLTWENAYDPQLDVITYETEVWLDAAMTLLFDGASEIVEDSSGESTWKVENALTENSTVWWRVRAHDGSVESPWSDPASFVVNEINEAPGQPVAISPIDDVVVAVEYPLLEWSLVEDGDGDAVTYAVEIWGDDPDTILVSSDALSFDEETDLYGGWVVDVILAENRTYYWSVTATDEHELDSDASVPAAFYYSLENEAPDVVEWVSPVDGEIVEADSPDLTATESTDPEGESVSYRFEVDLVETFDSADLVSGTAEHSGSGTVTWRTGDDGVVLPSNTTVFARVRAEDPEGVPSAWAVISFFVAGTNDPPEVPTLLSPEDGSTTEVLVPVLVAGHVTDPEGDGLFYDFVVASDVQLTAVIAEVSGVVGGSGPEGSEEQVSWQVPINMDGTVYWSARSVDVGGAASEWAVPFTLIVSGGEDELPQEVVDALAGGGPTSGCNCESSVAGGQPGSAWALLLLLVPALRRRRGSA